MDIDCSKERIEMVGNSFVGAWADLLYSRHRSRGREKLLSCDFLEQNVGLKSCGLRLGLHL